MFIDLVFTDQPNLVVHSGVHLSLHKNCHHCTTSFSDPDYRDIICNQACNGYFQKKLESIQYNAGLAEIRAKRWPSREKLYYELGFESLESRWWHHKLYCCYKVFKIKSSRYLIDITPKAEAACITRSDDKLPPFKLKHNYFKNSFFPFDFRMNWILTFIIPMVSLCLKGNILFEICSSSLKELF